MIKTRLISAADNAYSYPLLIKRLLLSAPRYGTGREIIYGGGIRHGYPEFIERVHRLAHALTRAGVRAGQTVAVMDWDSHRYLECFFAVPMIGAVLHTVNVRLSPQQILYTMNHAEDDLVLAHDDFLPMLEEMRDRFATVRGFIRLSDGLTPAPQTPLNVLGEYETLLAAEETRYNFPDFDENSIATLFYTTGTTGNPKGVCFSHRQLVLHTLGLVSALSPRQDLPALRSDAVYMPLTPMFHVHAWGVPYAATMLGIKQVYPGRYEPETLVRLQQTENVTFSHCVPTVLQMILESRAAEEADFRGWQVLIGGSALTAGLARTAAARGIRVSSGYGMSETCPIISTTSLTDEQQEADDEVQIAERIRAGVPVPMVDLDIVDNSDQPLPRDGHAMGELVLRAPWLTRSYYREPDKSEQLWRHGWLHTGDVASLDGRGTIDIRDRIKDVIKTGGEWISSLTLENLISAHPDITMAAVIARPDERWGERPQALLIRRAGADTDAAAIRAHLQQYVDDGSLSRWAIPERIDFVDDIPRTSVGKIDKKRLREQYSDRLGSD